MRRLLIHTVLPTAFAVVPLLAVALVFAAVPVDARRQYLDRITTPGIDWVILAVGFPLFAAQTALGWRALRLSDDGKFDPRAEEWLSLLTQAAEWFPLLGLLGTVAAILQTFAAIPGDSQPKPQDIIRNYAPAITATGSGLFMALANILPAWVTAAGQKLIKSLAGSAPEPVALVPAPVRGRP